MSRATFAMALTAVLTILLFPAATAQAAGKDGTLKDFEKLDATKNLAKGRFKKDAITNDASKLEKTNHYSKYSKWFALKPKSNYTLGVLYKAAGPSLVSAGVKWKIAGQPLGLVDREDHYACWPEAKNWTLKVLTFTSDPEYTKTQIILKAYGGMKVELKAVKLVEGWYSDR